MEAEEENHTKRRLNPVWLLAGLVLVAGLATVVSWTNERAVTEVELSDGSVLRVERVSYGTNHTFQPTPAWKRWAHDTFGYWGHLLGSVAAERRTTTPPAPVVWLQYHPSPTSTYGFPDKFILQTETGQTIRYETLWWFHHPDPHQIQALTLLSAPRRERWFEITPEGPDQPTMLIPNPLFGRKWPEWKPEPLPITNTVGQVDFVLRDAFLQSGTNGLKFAGTIEVCRDGRQLEMLGKVPFPARTERWLPRNRDQRHWHEPVFLLSDATGNTGLMIPTNEPAWQVEAPMFKTLKAVWHTNESVELTLPAFPPPGQVKQLKIERTVNGVELKELWIGGAGEFRFSKAGGRTVKTHLEDSSRDLVVRELPGDWETEVRSGDPWIALHTGFSGWSLDTFIELRDATGIEVRKDGANSDHTVKRYCDIIHFTPSSLDRAKPFTITVRVRKPIRTRFIIDPAKLRREKSP